MRGPTPLGFDAACLPETRVMSGVQSVPFYKRLEADLDGVVDFTMEERSGDVHGENGRNDDLTYHGPVPEQNVTQSGFGGIAGLRPYLIYTALIFSISGGPPRFTNAATSLKNSGPMRAGVTTASVFVSFCPKLLNP